MSGDRSTTSRKAPAADRDAPATDPDTPASAPPTTPDAGAADRGRARESVEKPDPIRRVTLIVLGICLVVFVWYVLADRHTPYTAQARIHALTVPLAPRVSGYVSAVNVRLHSVVEAGEVLFQLDRRPFELAVRSAEANVDIAAQQVGAQTATVKSAAARLGVARAQLDRAERNYDRVQAILADNPGALSQADRDRAETGLAQSVERVASAEADLEKAKQQLGMSGPDNPQLRAAMVALEQAQLDLAFTEILAPSRGAIESFNIDVGHNAQAGQALATFVSTRDVWIQADMRENNLGNIEPGDRVEFVLDAAPGRVFRGSVRSVGYGVDTGAPTSRGELPTITGAQGWLRDPQRFPVIVHFDAEALSGVIRAGGQADVIVYTGGNLVLNAIGAIQIRLASLLSYVR